MCIKFLKKWIYKAWVREKLSELVGLVIIVAFIVTEPSSFLVSSHFIIIRIILFPPLIPTHFTELRKQMRII